MKFKVQMKDPDVLIDAITNALEDQPKPDDLDESEWKYLREIRADNVYKFAAQWFEYGEYLTVELDTDAQTCVVMKKGQQP